MFLSLDPVYEDSNNEINENGIYSLIYLIFKLDFLFWNNYMFKCNSEK